ncbi:hypothetical protein [Paraburkholderia terrae]|uniref:hypothetical protein n=1 Tax=Paraburkholderia terrae TaxID=311230 RepID=UPI001EE230B7|nr:hypothetical protein [Paraburkholderia terrae]GJH00249.1 hypothetical protein CBA19C8_06850 [Paraburkholderia terrae]
MIVDPDFIEHWKTRMLAELLGENNVADEMAPLYVLRLWAHCQQRKTDRFESMSAVVLKAMCRFKGAAETFERAMLDARFIEREGDLLIVHDWRKHNAALFANWENGKRGGRPKGRPPQTDGVGNGDTAGFAVGNPMANPLETRGFPPGFDSVPDWVRDGGAHEEPFRLDKSREDLIGGSNTAYGASNVGGPGVQPSGAVQLSIAARAFGVQCHGANPMLIELAEQGITPETMTAACADARKSKGEGVPFSLGYVVGIIKRWSQEASQLQATGAQPPRVTKGQAIEQSNRDAVEEAARRIEARAHGAAPADEMTIDMEPV